MLVYVKDDLSYIFEERCPAIYSSQAEKTYMYIHVCLYILANGGKKMSITKYMYMIEMFK